MAGSVAMSIEKLSSTDASNNYCIAAVMCYC